MSDTFTYVDITRVTPKGGTILGGTSVTITGYGFTAATGVTFGGIAATNVVIVSTTTITCVTPAHRSGVVDVAVLGVGTGANLYTYAVSFAAVSLPPVPTTATVTAGFEGTGAVTPSTAISAGTAAAAGAVPPSAGGGGAGSGGGAANSLMQLAYMKWLMQAKQVIENIPNLQWGAEQVVGPIDPDQVPQLPFSRLTMDAPRLLGRTSTGTGDAEEITVGPTLTLADGLLSVAGLPNGYTIGDLLYADTDHSLALLSDVAAGSYLRSGGVATAPLWSTLTLPDAAASGDILVASGANAMAAVAPAALTKTDDTNVTLTLGGSAATALVNAASLTLGWTGQLGLARGGTHADLSATGGAKNYLKQASVGADITVGTIPASDIVSGAALTAVNDTNVTLTLGGAPTSALLVAASITAGWTGQLGVTRGGTGLGSVATGDLLYGSAANTLSARTIGSSGDVLTVSGGLPVWAATSGLGTGDLTRTNDTNVTVTLGGTPTGALFKSVSLTLGWTGTLGLSRGGTAADLSATGGTSQFLRQNSAGAAITVVRPAVSDLSDGTNVALLNALNTFTAFGTHAWTAGGAGNMALIATNTTSGATSATLIRATAGTTSGSLVATSQGYTTGSYDIQASTYLQTGGVGGLSLVASDAAGVIRFYSGGSSERARITAAGKVGIASTNPQSLLHVGGGTGALTQPYDGLAANVAGAAQVSARNSTDSVEIGLFAHTATGFFGTWTNHPLQIRTNNADAMRVHVSGGVSIGNTTDPGAHNLSLSGVFTASVAGSHGFTSGATSGSNNLDVSINNGGGPPSFANLTVFVAGAGITLSTSVIAGVSASTLGSSATTFGITATTLALTGKTTTYNNIATVGWGTPAIYGRDRQTGKTGAISANLYTPSADCTVVLYVEVTVVTATTHNFTVQLNFTNESGTASGSVITFVKGDGTGGGATTQAITNAGGAISYLGIPITLRLKGGTTLSYLTGGTFTTVNYNIEATVAQAA